MSSALRKPLGLAGQTAGHCRGILGVDGDHLPATAPHQEHPVEALCQDLKKFHIWGGQLRQQLVLQTGPHVTEELA